MSEGLYVCMLNVSLTLYNLFLKYYKDSVVTGYIEGNQQN